MLIRLAALVWFLVCAVQAASAAELHLERIKVPPGFQIELYASGLSDVRSLAQGPDGLLFAGSTAGAVYAIEPQPRRVHVIARDLADPNGVAFRDGALYVAEISRILRFDGIARRLTNPPPPVVIFDKLPSATGHARRPLRFGPDGHLYVGIGAPCNVCLRHDPFASIARLRPDGTGFEVFARGIRNSVGFDWEPGSSQLWFTDNGRDRLGDDFPPDELNRAPRSGLHFGFPFCHGANMADPEFGSKRACAAFVPPEQDLQPHGAALGMRFYRGSMFPSEYQNSIFICEHGSWDRSSKTGYRVTNVILRDGKAVDYKAFAEGWLENETAWGRPVDLEVLADGSIAVSDDAAGAIYRITYRR